ncbi:uncharacterized protein LOC100369681 [Saccoglossus kowalevskii]|uniref:Uncharacterized protein LOC100369681 n=1 Tax=Saccoglossus kowalevskii TaxID=10224 RepID=A0ABM0GW62_SACKO|nr:PREDICTED: uncharacterized protein LOC100369681 [Saccoglossus kowalevskii]
MAAENGNECVLGTEEDQTASDVAVRSESDSFNIEVQPCTLEGQAGEPVISEQERYKKKYFTLKRKCDLIKNGNDKLVNRLYYVKKAIRKLKRERQCLMSKLDEHGDDYKNVPLTVSLEDSLQMNAAGIPPNFPPTMHHPGMLGMTHDMNFNADSLATGLPPHMQMFPQQAANPVSASGSSKKKRHGKTEKEKDPNAPKRPANAFFMFCQQERPRLQEEYYKERKEEISHLEMTKVLSKKWSDLSGDDKERYYNLYQKDKERYEEEMKHYIKPTKHQPKHNGHAISAPPPAFVVKSEVASQDDPYSMPQGNVMPHGNVTMSQGNATMSQDNVPMSQGNVPMSQGNVPIYQGIQNPPLFSDANVSPFPNML